MMTEVTTLADGLAFPETPRWRHARLYFSDMDDNRVMTVDLDGRTEVVAEVPTRPSGLGWLPDGTLLVVSMHERTVLKVGAGGELSVHADLSDVATFHCNDMVVDAQGRAYVGNFGWDPRGDGPEREGAAGVDRGGTGRGRGRDGTNAAQKRLLRPILNR